MSKYSEAAEAIDRLAVQYQGMLVARDLLREVGSLDQAAAEANRAREKADTDRDLALVELADVQREVARAQDTAKAVLVEAQVLAAKVQAGAEERANAVLHAADAYAGQVRERADENAERAIAGAEKKVIDVLAELKGKQEAVINAGGVLEDLEGRITEAQGRLDAIREQIKKFASA